MTHSHGRQKKSACIWSVISQCYFTIVTLLFLFPAVQNGLQLLDNCLPAVNQSICGTVGILRRETITFGKRTCTRTCFLTNVLCRTWSEYRAGPVWQVGHVERGKSFMSWASWLDASINCWWGFFFAALPFPFLGFWLTHVHGVIFVSQCLPEPMMCHLHNFKYNLSNNQYAFARLALSFGYKLPKMCLNAVNLTKARVYFWGAWVDCSHMQLLMRFNITVVYVLVVTSNLRFD